MHNVRPFLRGPFERPGTLLYVGFRPDACSWLDELAAAGNEVTILEVWPHNVTSALGDSRISRFVVGDVRNVNDAALESRYDHIWWWHGPEHVKREEWPGLFTLLSGKVRDTLAVASPWGQYPQGPHAGNPHEIHLWSVYEDDFLLRGLNVVTDGEKDQPGSEIVGWVEA